MYTLVVDDISYSIPDGLTVNQWSKIDALNVELDAYNRQLVKVVLDIDDNIVKLIPDETIDLVTSFIVMKLESYLAPKDSLALKDLTKLTFGEFIDLDVYLDMGLWKSISEISTILFPDFNSETKVNQVIDGVKNYVNYRSFLFKQYSGLFSAPELNDDDDSKPQPLIKSWYSVTASLVNDDITKLDEVLSYPVIKVFNFMAYRKEQRIREIQNSK